MKEKFNWRDWLNIASFIVVFVTAIFVFLTLKSAAKGISEQLTATFNQDISNENSTGIITAMDNKQPILVEHGGHFDDEHLDNYLGIYETMDGAYLSHQIDRDDFCAQFSLYIRQAKDNTEINNYIKKTREDYKDPTIYTGFEELASKSFKDCK